MQTCSSKQIYELIISSPSFTPNQHFKQKWANILKTAIECSQKNSLSCLESCSLNWRRFERNFSHLRANGLAGEMMETLKQKTTAKIHHTEPIRVSNSKSPPITSLCVRIGPNSTHIFDFTRQTKNLNIVFRNCQGLRPKRKELQNYLLENQIDILALNETFLKPKFKFHLLGYDIYKNDRLVGTKGRVASW